MRMPISIKLVVITVSLLLGVTTIIAYMASSYFQKTSQQREESINVDFAVAKGHLLQAEITSQIEKLSNLGTEIYTQYIAQNADQSFSGDELVRRHRHIMRFSLVTLQSQELWSWSSPDHEGVVFPRPAQYGLTLASSKSEPYIEPLSVDTSLMTLRIYLPLVKDAQGGVTHLGLIDLNPQLVSNIFNDSAERNYFVVDAFNKIVFHSLGMELFGKSMEAHELVKMGRQANSPSKGQRLLQDPLLKDRLYSAYYRTGQDFLVSAQVSEQIILEPALAVKRRIFLIGGVVLSVSIFLVFLFSLTLSSPIEKLAKLMELVKKGDFDIRASQNIATILPDEVNDLASAVDQMAEGLKERDKVKNLFSKFVGSSVTDDLLQREVALGGARKDVVVFFSDIRGFTSMSESMPPEDVVEMLNAYFGRMVRIINETGGVVDKFIGDAIMAVWGAPNPGPDDAARALRACIRMRESLNEYNQERVAAGKEPLMIGMGLHLGPAVAGTIGSDERMEYTVIGNTVNTSSRIEAATKAFGADLLISQEIFSKTQDSFILEHAGDVEVKGRSEVLSLYKVRGYKNESGENIYVKTPYSDYEAEDADKVKRKDKTQAA